MERSNGQTELQIKGSEVDALSPSTFSTSYLSQLIETYFLENFKIGPATNIESHLSHIAIYQPVEPSDDHMHEGVDGAKNMPFYVEKGPGNI